MRSGRSEPGCLAQRDRSASCPICASRAHWAFDSRFVAVHRCDNEACSHLFAVGVDADHGLMQAAASDAIASLYEERNERLIDFWERTRFVTGGSKLLDVGAGTGHLSRSLRKRHPAIEILCVEQSESLRARLETQGFEVAKDLDAVPSDSSFDAVLLMEVIEHVADPVGMLSRLRGCLDPEGRIFLTTPCGELRDGSRTTNAYDTPEHVQFFTERSLQLAVAKAGFRGIAYEYIDALYPRGSGLLSLATCKRWLKNGARPLLEKLQGARHLTGFVAP